MAKERSQVVDYLVYLGVRVTVAVLQMLPMETAYFLARILGRLGYVVDRRHRRVALVNVEHAFGGRLTDRQRLKLVRAVYDHFAKVIVEIALIPRKLHLGNWKKRVTLDNVAQAVSCVLSDRPTIIVTGHFGNWEMAGYLVAAIGIKSYAIARDLDNRYLHEFVQRFRQWSGQTILSKTRDFARILRVLADGELLISVGDQSAGPRGYFVEFFGRSASTHKGVALLAMKYNAPVIVGYALREGRGFHYRVGCSNALDPRDYLDSADPAVALTQDFTRALETVIRRTPEQYLWLHNRWKHEPNNRVRRAA
jgi:KDO2-lipid IV(A) lauroyltransferase